MRVVMTYLATNGMIVSSHNGLSRFLLFFLSLIFSSIPVFEGHHKAWHVRVPPLFLFFLPLRANLTIISNTKFIIVLLKYNAR